MTLWHLKVLCRHTHSWIVFLHQLIVNSIGETWLAAFAHCRVQDLLSLVVPFAKVVQAQQEYIQVLSRVVVWQPIRQTTVASNALPVLIGGKNPAGIAPDPSDPASFHLKATCPYLRWQITGNGEFKALSKEKEKGKETFKSRCM